MRWIKRLIFLSAGLAAAIFLAGFAYAVVKYGPIGSIYAARYQLTHIAEKLVNLQPVSAGTSSTQLTSIPFDYVEIDSAIAGDCKMVGDIDGDGYPDLVIGGMPQEKLNWYRYPNWEKTEIAVPGNEFTTDGELGDVDGDGDLDVVVPDGDSGDNLLWFKNPLPSGDPGSGSQWIQRVIGPIGGWGKDIELADFDGDGRLDVATRNEFNAMIFFQVGLDQWSRTSLDGFEAGHEGMASGDIDGDGDADLVLRGVWLRNPDGQQARTAASWTQHTIGSAHQDFKALVADLNLDGKMDVLFTSTEGVADVDWWTPQGNNPIGNWTKHTVLPSMDRIHTLQAADMDGDGDIDLVLGQMHTSEGKEILIMENADGAGLTWNKQLVGTGGLHNGVVADIGDDGDYDIFGANWTGNPPVKLWVNRQETVGRWVYKQVTSSHQQTFGLAFGDVDGDGDQEILSGNFWYHNPGGDLLGDWSQSPFPEGMHAALAMDVDEDPWLDVIAQKDEGDIALYWLEVVDGSGSQWNSVKIGTVDRASHSIGAQGYRTAQVEAGGKPQVLFSSGKGIYYFRIPSDPAGGNWPRIHVSANPSDEGFAAGDIDGDGDLDLAATTGDSKRIEWYQNPGNGAGEWTAYAIGTFSEALFPDRTEVADLNGDGKLDIIVTEENGGESEAETFWWEQPGDPTQGDWSRHLVVTQGTTNSLEIADMDTDGDPDILLAEHRGSKKLAIHFNNGAGQFSEGIISQGKESHLGARTVDLDGDGDLDILSIAWDENQFIHLWRNDSGGKPPQPSGYLIHLPGVFKALRTISSSVALGTAEAITPQEQHVEAGEKVPDPPAVTNANNRKLQPDILTWVTAGVLALILLPIMKNASRAR